MSTDTVIRALAEALWPALQPAGGSEQQETSYWSTSGAECPQMIQEVSFGANAFNEGDLAPPESEETTH